MKISVYIPSYNQKGYLIEAIESVLAQTLRPFEIIIVDDCSSDGSQQVIAAYAARYPDLVIPVYHVHNQGIALTRNDALQRVGGDYVTYVDGDDRFLPTKLEKERRLLQNNPGAEIAFSNIYYMTAEGIRTGLWADAEKPPQGDVFSKVFARDFPRQSLFRNDLVNYQAWKGIGFYDPELRIWEDDDMRLRLTKKLKAVYHDEPLAEYRIHDKGLSRAGIGHHLKALRYVYEKNLLLLDDVEVTERWRAQCGFIGYMAQHAERAANQLLMEDSYQFEERRQLLSFYLWHRRCRPFILGRSFVLKALLPGRVYWKLWSARRRLSAQLQH